LSAGALKKQLKMATQIIDVILPVLKDRDGDIKKEWYIEFSCFSEKENKMIRYRKSYNMNRITNPKARRTLGEKMVKEVTADLHLG
jgi:hypothetical protein